ncbi:hypothetical protein JG687_00008676 [Phytophthora cactorum]|uniref:Transposase IS30-like HTH domain-containing protein n=1 Tax=Phytophthora cactorum TaxID=29920 RepID=A0A8T1GIR6_9STRA|nr:hypothetical protein Pcac1_g3437 [Phytophthora cactorum]KAG2885004.1 hypothetical protein PC114_g19890 [Phytophthora cactorum]KAG2947568.1 hypothetical protein PC117_g6686 [Phytophthora cactorum]KAG2969933.1 hypothetical protein PC119_g23780 [Phytophthora cactorum]KAG2989590.1 hypothetical protein PC118_g6092 [Phytophthora cactorum]
MGHVITDEERGRIKGLHEAGLGVRAIARRGERNCTAVGNAINARSLGEKKMGRPPSLTDRQVRQIVRAAATGDYSAAELARPEAPSAPLQEPPKRGRVADGLGGLWDQGQV